MSKDSFFDIKGIIGIQVSGTVEKDLFMLRNQLGAQPVAFSNQHIDIKIQFTDTLAPGRLNLLGINQYGYSDEDFYLLDRLSGKAEAKIDLAQIGEKLELVCQSGIKSVPLLTEILKLTFLKKDVLSLHASAVQYLDEVIAITGWVRGGKTSALLAYMQKGAKFIADDWLLWDIENDLVFGFPGQLSISDYHIQQVPFLKNRLRFSDKLYLNSLKFLIYILKFIANATKTTKLKKLVRKLNERLRIDLDQEDIFPPENILKNTSPQKFLLMVSQNQANFSLEAVSVEEFVETFIYANEFDLFHFYETYLAFRFAFPNKRIPFIENRLEMEKRLLLKGLATKNTFKLFHPYPLHPTDYINDVIEA